MRISYLSHAVIPSRYANSVHIMRMCAAMSSLGHDVQLSCLAGSDTSADPFEYYGVEHDFDIVKYSWNSFLARTKLGDLKIVLNLDDFAPDQVFGRSIPACAIAARRGYPVYLELHTPPSNYGWLERLMLNNLVMSDSFGGLVVISEALRKLVCEQLDIAPEFVLVAADAADELPEGDAVPIGPTDRLQICYIGQLYAGRGVELIHDMALDNPSADFHLVGGMEDAVTGWRAKAADMGNFHIHGFVPPSETINYLKAADILLAPYQNRVTIDNKGDSSLWMSPLKVFEYMSAGKAILISDIPVLHEVFENSRQAIMLAPDDVDAWSNAIKELQNNPALRHEMGAAAQLAFLRRFTWKQRAKAIVDQF